MRRTLFLIVITVLKSTVFGCPSSCFCVKNEIYCNSIGVTTVPSGIPISTTGLLLGNNNITTIDVSSFKDLTNLRLLYLGNNQITTVEANSFQTLTALETLYLNHNQIAMLNANMFKGLTAILNITLLANLITTLEANVFKELTTLEVLLLHDNQISTVDANAFSGLTALRGMTLHNNHITTIDVNVLNGLTALIYVEISDNPLKCTNCEMKQLRMLLERLVYGNLTSAMCDGGTLLADYDFDDCTGVPELTTKTTSRPTTIVTTTRPDGTKKTTKTASRTTTGFTRTSQDIHTEARPTIRINDNISDLTSTSSTNLQRLMEPLLMVLLILLL